MTRATPARYQLLDSFRGVAAISVLIWHYQHFERAAHSRYTPDAQPFAFFLSPFYNHGENAVYFFFILSGFVFFHVYSDRIRQRQITYRDFFVFRFSRLYPLHLATLLAVIPLQGIYQMLTGTYFIYSINDLKHFLLQILLISQWGFEDGYSFNGPAWSISVEEFVYIVFFASSTFLRSGLRISFILLLLSITLIVLLPIDLARGLICFYVGGCVYETHMILAATVQDHELVARLVRLLLSVLTTCAFLWLDAGDLGVSIFLVYPLVVLSASMWQLKSPSMGRLGARLGGLTYSIYLIHFPVSVVLGIFNARWGWFPFESPMTFVTYTGVTLILSYLSYHYFENPMKSLIRGRFTRIP